MLHLNRRLVKVMAFLCGSLVLISQLVLWKHLPESSDHPVVADDRQKKMFARNLEVIRKLGAQPQPEHQVSRQQQQQRKRGHRQAQPQQKQPGRLRINMGEKHAKATAQTISPFLKHPLMQGKEPLLTMLHEMHYFNDSAPEFFQDAEKVQELAHQLPTWNTITQRLGGSEPTIIGLDTCEQFQKDVDPVDRFLGVAGLFATGTNLLASLLVANCENPHRTRRNMGKGVRWQVNWGKHSPARFRLQNTIDPNLHNMDYLPVVTIRSPYSWMQSMCRQRYSTHWFHNAQVHCPNLVPNELDRYWYTYTQEYGKRGIHALYKDPWLRDNLLDLANFTLNSETVPVRVRYKSGTLYHDSLIHMWNEWYQEYLQADFPRIIVRLEDLVFHGKEVVTKVCHCMGGKVQKDFQYVTETAKVGDENIHGKTSDRTNMIKWFTKWHLEDRTKNMTLDDRAFAKQHLDTDLLQMFQYQHPGDDERSEADSETA